MVAIGKHEYDGVIHYEEMNALSETPLEVGSKIDSLWEESEHVETVGKLKK